jgi:UDP-glucose 4-epimerase
LKKVLITGGLGFIGSNLAERCIDLGYDTTIISKSDLKIKNIDKIKNKIKLIFIDVKNIKDEVKNFDYIFHLAGTTDNYNILKDPYKDVNMNCTATIALLEACKKFNPKVRLVFASTFFVNGNPKNLPVDSSSPCNPLGLYGATRLTGEYFCKIYNKIFDMNSVIVRFTNVFGIKEQFNNKKKAGFNYLINLAIQKKEIPIYDGGNFVRDYIYVEDVVNACLTIAKKGKINKIYYVGRGKPIKFKDMIKIVIDECGGGKIKSIDPPDFHKRIGIKNFVCNNKNLRKLGWKPKISLKEGIKKTIKFYKKNKNE